MKMIKKIVFMPILLIASVANVMAGIIKKIFSFVSGIFFLLMVVCLCAAAIQQAWGDILICMACLLMGYAAVFSIVVLKVAIEEFKDYCLRKVF